MSVVIERQYSILNRAFDLVFFNVNFGLPLSCCDAMYSYQWIPLEERTASTCNSVWRNKLEDL